MPRVTVTITKNASLAAIARYIIITTIYTVGYLQIFNTGHFFQISIAMICKERSIGLPWFSTKTQITTLINLASRAAPSWYITELITEHVSENFGGGIARFLSP